MRATFACCWASEPRGTGSTPAPSAMRNLRRVVTGRSLGGWIALVKALQRLVHQVDEMAHVLVLPASTALVHRVGEGDVHVRIGEPERAAGAGRSPLRRLGAAPLDRQHVSTERAAFPERGEGLCDLGKREYPVHDRFDTAAGHEIHRLLELLLGVRAGADDLQLVPHQLVRHYRHRKLGRVPDEHQSASPLHAPIARGQGLLIGATNSSTTSTPWPSVSLRTASWNGPLRASTTASAPSVPASSSLASFTSTAITQPPAIFAICSACRPTPPTPISASVVPGRTCARLVIAW